MGTNLFSAKVRAIRGPGLSTADRAFIDSASDRLDVMPVQAANYLGAGTAVLRNLFDKRRAVADTNIAGETGETYYAADISLTGSIPVGGLGTVTAGVPLFNYCFYDYSGAFLTGGQSLTASPLIDEGDPLTVPADAFYLRFGLATALVEDLMVVPGNPLPASFVPFPAPATAPWAGKKFGFVGDSISAVHVYQPMVAELLDAKFVQFTDDGFSGRKMGEAVPVLTGGNLGTLDLLGVFLGTNDFGGNTPLGAHGDATDAGTFYGNTRSVIETALSANLDMQVMMVTPMKRGVVSGLPAWDDPNTAGHVLEDYVDAIIRVAADYAVPVLDMFRVSNFNDLTLATYASDRLHPSTMQAWNMIARKFAAFIRTI